SRVQQRYLFLRPGKSASAGCLHRPAAGTPASAVGHRLATRDAGAGRLHLSAGAPPPARRHLCRLITGFAAAGGAVVVDSGPEQVAHGRAIDSEEHGACHGVTRQRAALSSQGSLVSEELARTQPDHRLVCAVAFAANLDLAFDNHVVVLAGITRPEDDLARFVDE